MTQQHGRYRIDVIHADLRVPGAARRTTLLSILILFVLASPRLVSAQPAKDRPKLEVTAVDDVSEGWEGAKISQAPPATVSFELLPGGACRLTPTVTSPSTLSWSTTPEGFLMTATSSRGRTETTFKVVKDNGDGTGVLSMSFKQIWDGEDITQQTVDKGRGGEASYIKKKTAPVKTATENAIGNLMDVETPAPTPTPDATESPTPTASPTSSPTEDKDSALRSALQKLPEYAGLPQEQLDRVIAKFKDTSLASNWSDAMKAEMEWYKEHGVEPGHPVIKAATPKPTPIAELRAPYDWITHTRRESDLAAAIQQLNTRLKEGLDEHTQNSERQAELRRELEILRHVRESLIRSPARSLPRLPARR
jgi:hypothetical protein